MRSQMTTVLAIQAMGLGLATQAAWGTPLLVEFSGKITGTQVDTGYWGYNPLDPSVTEGATFYGSLSYDPLGAVDTNPDPYHGSYYMGTAIVGKVGAISVAAYEMSVYVSNDPTYGYDELCFWATNPDGGSEGLPFTALALFLNGPPALLQDDSLPPGLDLDLFAWATFEVLYEVEGDPPYVALGAIGTIDAFAVTPEPATLTLLLLGVAFTKRFRQLARGSHRWS